MEHLPRLSFSLDPLIAEAKRRARQRRVLLAVGILLVAGLAAGLTLAFRSQGVGPSGGLATGSGIVFAHIANPVGGTTLGGGGDIYVLRPGGRPRLLMRSRDLLDQPTWSPDGRLIAFASTVCNGDVIDCLDTGRPVEVFVANSDGSHQRQLTFPSANEYELRSDDPSWSPNGRGIAFLRELAANSRLAIVSIASGKTRLLHVHGMVNDPVWGKPGIAYLNRTKRSSSAVRDPNRRSDHRGWKAIRVPTPWLQLSIDGLVIAARAGRAGRERCDCARGDLLGHGQTSRRVPGA